MSVTFELNAEVRTDVGKGASRRLRHANKVPAVIYGGGKDPVSLTMEHDKLFHALENEAFYSHILTIKVDGKGEKAIMRDLQRHPSKPRVMHADFQRVSATEKIHMNVPLHFENEEEAVGVKEQGGQVSHNATDVEISCLAKDLPEYISVDVAALEVGHALHLSDLVLPEGVELVQLALGEGHDQPVVSIHMPRVVAIEEEEEAIEGGEEAAEGEEAPE
ncbi:50S ribosomal protein L25/general stress protein Ctc [Sulfuriflexus mobilis]|uniref:50S ribosomal protein L25/general stress protein Ctc n=1 Tax=Sulfuriflexus mobilis TaxID=1811807 RepID=UPI000F82DD0F|nr:50S ribosomal protein L25/general stress protein Ctc [Sulfuriflexus mobilis]